MNSLLLTMAHHIVVVSMIAILVVEILMIRPGISAQQIARLRQLDGLYGSFIALILFIGIMQVSYGEKGQDFYTENPAFWMKMIAFVAVGLISVQPSLRIYTWWQQARGGSFFSAPPDELARVRIFLRIELAVFATIPIFAVISARGIGS
jgi:putative membrane protein